MTTINILMAIFTLLLLGIGGYLFKHRKKNFLIFHPTTNHLLSSVIRNFGIVFLTVGVLSLLTIITQNTICICIALIIGCLAVTAFYLCISKFIPR